MRKLTLDLDDLAVEAFETVDTPADQGTVDAHGLTVTLRCATCYDSCTCEQGCTELCTQVC